MPLDLKKKNLPPLMQNVVYLRIVLKTNLKMIWFLKKMLMMKPLMTLLKKLMLKKLKLNLPLKKLRNTTNNTNPIEEEDF